MFPGAEWMLSPEALLFKGKNTHLGIGGSMNAQSRFGLESGKRFQEPMGWSLGGRCALPQIRFVGWVSGSIANPTIFRGALGWSEANGGHDGAAPPLRYWQPLRLPGSHHRGLHNHPCLIICHCRFRDNRLGIWNQAPMPPWQPRPGLEQPSSPPLQAPLPPEQGIIACRSSSVGYQAGGVACWGGWGPAFQPRVPI